MSKKILLADDSVTIQKVVSITLAHEDFDLTIVDNGTEAVVKAKELRPDVILLDVVMPDKDGYEVCQEIKASNGLARTPIILLTGTFEPFDEDRASEVGADDFIKKPFESHALINKIKEMAFKGGVQKPAETAYSEVEEIDGLDDLEGIDDLGDFDDFETPSEVKAPEKPVFTEPAAAPEGEAMPIDSGGGDADDIWSVEEYDDISGSDESSDVEGADGLWGDEDLDSESDIEVPETTVIEETQISEESFAFGDETEAPSEAPVESPRGASVETPPDIPVESPPDIPVETPHEIPAEAPPEADLVDDDFELGGDISMDDLGKGIGESAFDDGGEMEYDDVSGDDLLSEDVEEIPTAGAGGADVAASDDGGFFDEGLEMETPGATGADGGFDDLSMDEFGKGNVPGGAELSGGDVDGFGAEDTFGGESVELDWGDDTGDVSGGDDFVFNDDLGGGDAGAGSSFEPAPSETSIKDEIGTDEWNIEDIESTPDSFGDLADGGEAVSMGMEVEREPGPETPDIVMTERSEEISRMVKEKVLEEGVIPDATKAGMSDKEVTAAVDKIAREIVQKVVWEVVPELAEELIKDEIRRLKGESEG